jgi:hypothetical protein
MTTFTIDVQWYPALAIPLLASTVMVALFVDRCLDLFNRKTVNNKQLISSPGHDIESKIRSTRACSNPVVIASTMRAHGFAAGLASFDPGGRDDSPRSIVINRSPPTSDDDGSEIENSDGRRKRHHGGSRRPAHSTAFRSSYSKGESEVARFQSSFPRRRRYHEKHVEIANHKKKLSRKTVQVVDPRSTPKGTSTMPDDAEDSPPTNIAGPKTAFGSSRMAQGINPKGVDFDEPENRKLAMNDSPLFGPKEAKSSSQVSLGLFTDPNDNISRKTRHVKVGEVEHGGKNLTVISKN